MKPPDVLSVYTLTELGRACVELRDIRPVGRLANGATEWEARVTYYGGGELIGEGRWGGDGFEAPVPQLLPDVDASSAAASRLEREVRRALAQY